MKGFPEEFDSIFRYIEVVSQRAAQLIHGARPRLETSHSKPTLQAKEEVDHKLVSWRVLTQEELEARRQELVEQFRAEMTPEGTTPETAPPEDVLPTSTEAAPPVLESPLGDEEEGDEDLLRLQRLIGFGGGGDDAVGEGEDETVAETDPGEHVED